MKTKLMAIVLCILMLVQPTMAIGMVGMESAEEIVTTIPEQEQEEEVAEVMTTANDDLPDNVIFFDDFEANDVKDWGEGKGGSYTFAYQKGETTAKLGNTDQGSKEVDGVVYKSNSHWQIIDDNGDKVLHITQYAAQHNNAGFDFNDVKLGEVGVYTLSFNLKLELGENAEGFGQSAGSDFCWFQHQKKNSAGTGSYENVPACSGINGTNGNANLGKWFAVSYRYNVKANADGTKTVNVNSNMNGWNPPAKVFAGDEYISKIRNYFYMYPAGKSQAKIYLDDVKLTFDPFIAVKYVNEAGDVVFVDNVEAANAATYTFATKETLGTDFYPAYFVNGSEVIANKYDISALGTEVTVTVKPNARIFYEDFETYTVGEALKVPYTAATPSSTRAYLYGTFRRENRKEHIYSGDENVNTDLDPDLYSNQEWVIVEDSVGNKAVKVTAQKGKWDSAGFKLDGIDLSKAGIYHFSFDAAEVDGSGGTWGDGQGVTEFGQPTLDGVVPNQEAFKHVDYTIVATDNGDGTFDYKMTNNTNTTTKTYDNVTPQTYGKHVIAFSVSSKTGNVEVYLDNFEFTYGQAVPVTYTDENGATIKTYTGAQGENLVLSSAAAGVKYAAKYTINGETYNEGGIYKIPATATALTIKVEKYSWADLPAEAPANAILYEDYNNMAGSYAVGNHITYYDDSYFTHTIPTFGSYGGKKIFINVDGKKVMSVLNYNTNYNGFRFSNLKLNKPGKYTLMHRAYIDSSRNGIGKVENTLNWYIAGDAAILTGTGSTFNANAQLDKQNQYQDYTSSIIITEKDGKLYNGTREITDVDNFLWYANWGADHNTYPVYIYVDYSYITYNHPVKVTVLGINGETLKTYDAYQNDKVWLPAINGTYTYNGNTYEAGVDFAVPADAQGEIVLRGTRLPMPSTVPTNTVVYEDFENKTVGQTVSAQAPHYLVDAFDGTTINQCEGSTVSKSYEKTPDGTGTALKIVSNAMYSNSMIVDLPDDIEEGKYNVSWKLYIDNDLKDVNDVNSNGNTDEYLNSIATWCRVWYGSAVTGDDGFVGASTNISHNDAASRKTWKTYSFDFEVFEEDGEKYVSMYSADLKAIENHVITGNLYLKLHTTTSNADKNDNTVYHDDLIITQVKPEVVTATFTDENGESFDYEGVCNTYNNSYKLPTAEMMGIDYLVEFVGEDGKTYYPGMEYALPAGQTSAEFVVKKTNVIFFEDYEGQVKSNAWLTPTYAVGPFATAKIYGNRINNNVNGTNSNVVTVAGTAIANTTPEFMNITLTQPGIYKFNMDVELKLEKKAETDLVDTGFYVNFQRISGWNNAGSDVYLREGELKKTLSGYVEIFEGEDGVLYSRIGSPTATAKALSATPITAFRTGLIWSAAFINSKEQRATYHMSFDNVKVEYTPFDPVNTMKASYRAINEGETGGPEGIRFAAYVTNGQRTLASEYGFVVTRKTLLGGDYSKLNLKGIDSVSATVTTTATNDDGVAVVAAAAYNGTVDRVYVQDGKVFGLQGLYDTFYTAVLYGLDTDVRKSEVFVARPYAKIDGIYYYGDCHETSYNDVKAAAEAANA